MLASIDELAASSSRSSWLDHDEEIGVRGSTMVPEREHSRMPNGRTSFKKASQRVVLALSSTIIHESLMSTTRPWNLSLIHI